MRAQAPRRELNLFFSRNREKAVILYRASNKLHRLIGWDLRSDSYTPGQWIKKTIYPQDCALSPDGSRFLYAGMNGGWAFLAVSHPPFFTAIAHVPGLLTWDLGGFFVDDATLALKVNAEPAAFSFSGLQLAPPGVYMNSVGEPLSAGQRAAVQSKERARRGQPDDLAGRYSCREARLFRKTPDGDQLLQDFSRMKFEPIPAPYQGVARSRWQ